MTALHVHKCEDCGCNYYCQEDCPSELYGTEFGECIECLGAQPGDPGYERPITTEEGE